MNLRKRSFFNEWQETHVEVKDLPDTLRQALKKLGYRGRDIAVVAMPKVSVTSAGGKGRRAFAASVNLMTGKLSDVVHGSWGGPNINTTAPLDVLGSGDVTLRPGMGIIKGSEGYHGTWATIYVHPDSLAKMLPGDADVTPREKAILHWARYKSAYKKEEFRRHKVTPQEIESLVKRGYMKMNKAGATSMTAKGKNAAAKHVDSSTGLPSKYEEKLRRRGYLVEAGRSVLSRLFAVRKGGVYWRFQPKGKRLGGYKSMDYSGEKELKDSGVWAFASLENALRDLFSFDSYASQMSRPELVAIKPQRVEDGPEDSVVIYGGNIVARFDAGKMKKNKEVIDYLEKEGWL